MGTRAELAQLVSFLDATGTKPLIDRDAPDDRGPRRASPRWTSGDVFGKVVFTR